ncbi:MAG: histidine kinase dimerization/phospho-acceptor domain-containing protein [Thermoanaerobaculia bacterium]
MERWLESFANAIFLRSSDTAHDLKTPLNIAVLNLEILRMRVRKITGGEDDAKLIEYAAAIETELRRMARIFDTFFVLSTPPKGEGTPGAVDVTPILAEQAEEAGFTESVGNEAVLVAIHDSRIKQALRMFFDGASRVFAAQGRRLQIEHTAGELRVTISGRPEDETLEPTRLFKFYYTDPSGNPDVSLAAARLVIETYGGVLNAVTESDSVSLRISLPTR